MATPVYNINLPTVFGSKHTWDEILNNDTFRCFDQYLQQNPSEYMWINGSGLHTSGALQINAQNQSWHLIATPSGTYKIEHTLSGPAIEFDHVGGVIRYALNNHSYTSGALYVNLSASDIIGDWVSQSTVDFTDIDLSDDGVPSGATGVMIVYHYVPSISSVTPSVLVRKNGTSISGDITEVVRAQRLSTGITVWTSTLGIFYVAVDSSSKIEAMNTVVSSYSSYEFRVLGYFI